MKRIIHALILYALLCALLLAGCERAEKDTEIILTTPFAEDEVFRIDTSTCMLPEVMVYMRTAQDQYEGLFGTEIWDKNLGDITLGEQLKDTILARLAQIKVMQLLAEQYGIALSADEQTLVDSAAGQYMATLSPEEIADMKVDETVIAGMYGEVALANKVYSEITKDVNPEISDDEARTIKVKHILIKTYLTDGLGEKVEFSAADKRKAKSKITDIKRQLDEGADFDELAGRYNEDDKTTYAFMKGDMPQTFEEAAFNLETDEVSDIVETEYGYHLIKCVSTFDRDETDENKIKIVQERKNEVFNEVYTRFVKTVYSNLNEELWESLDFEKKGDTDTTDFFEIYDNIVGQE